MSPALDLYAPPQRRRPADVVKDQRLPQTSPLVNYRYGIDPEQSCGTCTMFQPPGGCAAVTGMIRPVDTCDLWERDPTKTTPVSQPWALPAEQPANGVSQAPEVDDPEQLQQPGSPEDPTQAGVYAPQPRKGVIGPVRASLAGAREPVQAYFPHRDPARAYFVTEQAQAYFAESAAPVRATLVEAGTSAGAKKGWEGRRGGPGGVAAWKKKVTTPGPHDIHPAAVYERLRKYKLEHPDKRRQKAPDTASSEASASVRATLVEVGTKEGGRKGSLTRRGRNALLRRLAKSEREISMGHVKIGKVRV